MPLPPEQVAKIRQKEAETPDALKRYPLNGYTEGWFHVTLNTRGEAPVLGYITGNTTNGAVNNAQTTTRPVIELVGNMELLKWSLFPLVCHSTDVHLYEQQKEAVLRVARGQGGVIVAVCSNS